ncbi:MAG: hypothetical protein IPP03_06480 [Dechloromonas sp.]|jgi:hypothetical protein|nr:hypothetical protein [Candidatus Dechloromonas phosphoritropha]MBP8786736.1 hypothetical protein [Azonexus sp.]MBP9227343.1 hypothetical protein [Azonexus sp.]
MSTPAHLPLDTLAIHAGADIQKLAARMAQDIFAEIFRQTISAEPAVLGSKVGQLEQQCRNWCQAGSSPEARAARMALLIGGLDQWGLAYSQAFSLTAIPALSALIGALRNGLGPQVDARFQWYFNQIEHIESNAIDFKIALRRSIHLALWHAMAACETPEEARAILQALGGLMLGLDQRMPILGWRLLADALANIQIALLNDSAASDVAQESTQALFESLRHAMPSERYREILAHSGQAVLAWQQAKRTQGI